MKLSDVILQNADKYIQIQDYLDLGIDARTGKRRCCVMGLIGNEVFPDEFREILNDNENSTTGSKTDIVVEIVYERFGITREQTVQCLDGSSIVIANDDGQTFQQIGEKLAACGL